MPKPLTITTPGDRQIVIVREFDAPRDLVFLCYSKPELMRRWYGMPDWAMTVCDIDFRVGGRWRFVTRSPHGYELGSEGVYTGIEQPTRIEQTERYDDDWTQGGTTNVVSFTEADGVTMTTTTVTYTSPEARAAAAASPMAQGMEIGFSRLDATLTDLQSSVTQSTTDTNKERPMSQKLTPCLWMENIVEAANYYADVFKSPRPNVNYMPDGTPLTAHVDILGTTFMLLGQSMDFKFNESVSFSIDCKDQAEVDYYWNHFVGDGGRESQCGWCKDRFGLSWQIIPEALPRTIGGPDAAGRGRALQAMFKMRKLIVADLEAAYAG